MKAKTNPKEKPKKRGGIHPSSRTKYTASQFNAMETIFIQSQYPDSLTMEELGKSLNVSVERISIWFQNRRSKFKRQSKDIHMSWMRKQIFSQDTRQNQMTQPTPICQSPPEKRHVLSPPEDNLENPRSNYVSSTNEFSFYSGAMTTTCQPISNYSLTAPSQPSYTSSIHNALLRSHLLNDVTNTTCSMVTPGYQSCNDGNTTNNMYSTYPYYSPKINPYYSMNQQQQMSSS